MNNPMAWVYKNVIIKVQWLMKNPMAWVYNNVILPNKSKIPTIGVKGPRHSDNSFSQNMLPLS